MSCPSDVCLATRPRKSTANRYVAVGGKAAYLGIALFLFAGCGSSSTISSNPPSTTSVTDPSAEFEWGMKRLERMLQTTRPKTSDGIFTERKMTYELLPPTGSNEEFAATVTIISESEFIHGKRNIGKKADENSKDEEKPNFEDALNEGESDIENVLNIPGVGPQAPKNTAPQIETRTLEEKKVFELVYRDQKWQLKAEPEEELSKFWFEYAFPAK